MNTFALIIAFVVRIILLLHSQLEMRNFNHEIRYIWTISLISASFDCLVSLIMYSLLYPERRMWSYRPQSWTFNKIISPSLGVASFDMGRLRLACIYVPWDHNIWCFQCEHDPIKAIECAMKTNTIGNQSKVIWHSSFLGLKDNLSNLTAMIATVKSQGTPTVCPRSCT